MVILATLSQNRIKKCISHKEGIFIWNVVWRYWFEKMQILDSTLTTITASVPMTIGLNCNMEIPPFYSCSFVTSRENWKWRLAADPTPRRPSVARNVASRKSSSSPRRTAKSQNASRNHATNSPSNARHSRGN